MQKSSERKINKFLSKGFTLVELIVVFTIAALLSVLGATSFVSYSRTQQLNLTSEDIKLLVNEAKFSALSGVKKNKDVNGANYECSANLLGYSVLYSSGNKISLTQNCEGVGSVSIKEVVLSNGLSIDPQSTCSVIEFGPLASANVITPCMFIINGFGSQRVIDIDSAGNAKVNE